MNLKKKTLPTNSRRTYAVVSKLVGISLLPLLLAGQCGGTVEPTSQGYNRADWGDWINQGNGCDTRELVLKTSGSDVVVDKNCKPLHGSWISVYDDVVVTDSSKLDIDHIVPLKEAYDSGAQNWPKPRKVEFYNNLDNLLAVTLKSNRSKGDKDPAHWLPIASERCAYALRYTQVKNSYALSYDPAEKLALLGLNCKGVNVP